jgi:hypothetical protein
MPDDVAEEKVKALHSLGAEVVRVRPASIVDKMQVNENTCVHSTFAQLKMPLYIKVCCEYDLTAILTTPCSPLTTHLEFSPKTCHGLRQGRSCRQYRRSNRYQQRPLNRHTYVLRSCIYNLVSCFRHHGISH